MSAGGLKKNGWMNKVLGGILMASGTIVILYCVPKWFWTLLLGTVLIVLGFLIWRFCD